MNFSNTKLLVSYLPWLIGLGSVGLVVYRRFTGQTAEFIAENPNSLAAIKVTNPELYQQKVDEVQAYTAQKVDYFNSLSPEEMLNYKGGF